MPMRRRSQRPSTLSVDTACRGVSSSTFLGGLALAVRGQGRAGVVVAGVHLSLVVGEPLEGTLVTHGEVATGALTHPEERPPTDVDADPHGAVTIVGALR